jgi:predicted metal-binding membrane protein
VAVTLTERVLRRDRAIIATGLGALVVLAWAWLLLGAGTGMSPLHMTSWRVPPPSLEPAMPPDRTPAHVLVALAM